MITSPQNELIKHFTKLRTSKTYRYEEKRCLIFGAKMIQELSPFIPIKTLLFEQDLFVKAEKSFPITRPLLQKITGLPSPEGGVAEVEIPDFQNVMNKERVVVFDRIQDPGNLGTLIRSSVAFGFQGIYLVTGSADPYSDKAIRAAKGATFHIPFQFGEAEELQFPGSLYLADLEGAPLETTPFQKPFALLFGNEGQGINPLFLRKGKKVSIPIEGAIESLNVAAAAAIMLYISSKEAR